MGTLKPMKVGYVVTNNNIASIKEIGVVQTSKSAKMLAYHCHQKWNDKKFTIKDMATKKIHYSK